jgi:hypothetical protein
MRETLYVARMPIDGKLTVMGELFIEQTGAQQWYARLYINDVPFSHKLAKSRDDARNECTKLRKMADAAFAADPLMRSCRFLKVD